MIVTPVFTVMLVPARMLPLNSVVVPKVAEIPTSQKTLQASPPPAITTDDPDAVVRVLPIWKTQTPLPLRVNFPVSCAEDEYE
jgi:hypothetical protein